MMGFSDGYFLPPKPDPRKEALKSGSPRKLGNGWVEFVTSRYATRERRTRVLIDLKDLSSVDEDYEPEKWNGRDWCEIHLKNGKSYTVKATYDEMRGLLTKKADKEAKII